MIKYLGKSRIFKGVSFNEVILEDIPSIIGEMQEVVFPINTSEKVITSLGFHVFPIGKKSKLGIHALIGNEEQFEVATSILVHKWGSDIAKGIFPDDPGLRVGYIEKFVRDWYEKRRNPVSHSPIYRKL